MATVLRVLLINDNDNDREMKSVLREIRHAGYDVEYQGVETRAAMAAALSRKVWDIILCNSNLVQFSVIEALATLKESRQLYPFYLLMGRSGNDTVVTMFKMIAQDFIVKESLVPLLPSLAQAIRDVQTQRSHH